MTFGPAVRAIAAGVVIAATIALSGCAAVATSDESVMAAATSGGVRVAFYGDSYTKGSGTSEPELRWSTLLSQQHGWSEFNPSVSGLGFLRKRTLFGAGDLPSLIIAENPDIVIVAMGLNDNFTFDSVSGELPDQILRDFDRLSTELPDAQLIVVEPFWYTDERPRSVEVIISWVEDAAAEVGADYIPGASRWLEGHPEWMASDGLHPNDAGHAELAKRMDQALRTLGL